MNTDREFVIFVVAVIAICLVIAFFTDEPKDCGNVWKTLQHAAMFKACPR